jgi:hypothetical protein
MREPKQRFLDIEYGKLGADRLAGAIVYLD